MNILIMILGLVLGLYLGYCLGIHVSKEEIKKLKEYCKSEENPPSPPVVQQPPIPPID
jgi:uncharacterized protein YneF (UPF0154 family)